jgi:pimeloyl-ACP methyl ester carboxylesterase
MTDKKNNPFDQYHEAPLSYDKDGNPKTSIPFTPKADLKRYALAVPPHRVIPIIFVPGIMGSNLRLRNLPQGFADKRYFKKLKADWNRAVEYEGFGDQAWRPDDTVAFVAQRFWPLEAHERRRLLDPGNTEVDGRGDIAASGMAPFAGLPEDHQANFRQEFARRGWGTVMLSSYGPLLCCLEYHLNAIYYRGELSPYWRHTIVERERLETPPGGISRVPMRNGWGEISGDAPLTLEQLEKAARYWYPVHAAGYNWLQSNEQAGVHLAEQIDRFIKHYAAQGYTCTKAILVTHSMGGLVARAACHPQIGKAASQVLGVIHGVMPANGAGAAYKRCHAGFEYSSATLDVAGRILGKNGPEVTAVFSNSPGALQLLPNHLYGADWLRICKRDGNEVMRLPSADSGAAKADPYGEIYGVRDKWWRLMNPAWIDPVPNKVATSAETASLWTRYKRNLTLSRSFHELLDTYYHVDTYVHYGADKEKHPAFGSVVWKAKQTFFGKDETITQAPRFAETDWGMVRLADLNVGRGVGLEFEIAPPEDPGDGTVPDRSGAAPKAKAKFTARQKGYDHQDSYKNERVQELTLYCIARLVSESA